MAVSFKKHLTQVLKQHTQSVDYSHDFLKRPLLYSQPQNNTLFVSDYDKDHDNDKDDDDEYDDDDDKYDDDGEYDDSRANLKRQ